MVYMKVLKIKLTQKSANYRIPGTIYNRKTYPLPPFSSIIGAVHTACNWDAYHEMDVGVIGKYDSMHTDFKRIHYLLNYTVLDQGILVKEENGIFHPYLKEICKATGGMGTNFMTGKNTIYIDKDEFEKFKNLREQEKELKLQLSNLENQKKEIRKEKKNVKKTDISYEILNTREETLVEEQDKLKIEKMFIKNELSKYKSKQISTCYYEILNNIELIIYISTNQENLNTIQEHIYNFNALGRSEDFVNILSSEIIELKENINTLYQNKKGYNSYIDYNLIKTLDICTQDIHNTNTMNGTLYYINKDYTIKNEKRIFNKKPVIYANEYEVENNCKNVFIDDTEPDGIFIVNLL